MIGIVEDIRGEAQKGINGSIIGKDGLFLLLVVLFTDPIDEVDEEVIDRHDPGPRIRKSGNWGLDLL